MCGGCACGHHHIPRIASTCLPYTVAACTACTSTDAYEYTHHTCRRTKAPDGLLGWGREQERGPDRPKALRVRLRSACKSSRAHDEYSYEVLARFDCNNKGATGTRALVLAQALATPTANASMPQPSCRERDESLRARAAGEGGGSRARCNLAAQPSAAQRSPTSAAAAPELQASRLHRGWTVASRGDGLVGWEAWARRLYRYRRRSAHSAVCTSTP